jgi:hypothetical protein
VRACVPPPQVTLHALHALVCHEYVVHGCVLQLCIVAGFGGGHCVSATIMKSMVSMHDTARLCVPPPHCVEHDDHAPDDHWYRCASAADGTSNETMIQTRMDREIALTASSRA